MKFYRWIVLTLGIGLIIVSGFIPNVFKINAFTILILFILSIPAVAPYLKEAKLFGAKFIFKDEIIKTEKLIQESIEKAQSSPEKRSLPFETFNLDSVKEQLESDHVLALAALRIEIEKKLKLAADFLGLSPKDRKSVSRIVDDLDDEAILYPEQISALKKVLNMCNKAIHGVSVSYEDAEKIVDIADELNRSFSIGYSINFSPNDNYKAYGLNCEWEHCIEWLPLTEEDTELSCPVFGHNCPGGKAKVAKCRKTIEDIPKNRFVK